MAMDLTLLYHVSYGLYVVAAKDGDHANGCIINTCMQITSENPIFAISMNKDNYTYDLIKKEKRFVLSILSEQTDPAVISAFGFFSGRDRNQFEGFRYSVREDGLPVLEENVCATLVLDVLDMTDMETHVVFYGRLTDLLEGTAKTPMTYSYYHKVIKGKAPKNAPTYQADTGAKTAARYICDVCGYVYEGETLPEDYVCPVCGVDASHFHREEPAAEEGKPSRYVCDICGYVYEGEALPENYVCPVCGVDASHFRSE